jgi:hypothetical protein
MPLQELRALSRLLLVLSALLLGLANAGLALAEQQPIAEQQQQQQHAQQLFSADSTPGQRCAPEVPVGGLKLSAEEQKLLQYICWPEESTPTAEQPLQAGVPRGVPAGVNCTVVSW